jgi:hypothetical protein
MTEARRLLERWRRRFGGHSFSDSEDRPFTSRYSERPVAAGPLLEALDDLPVKARMVAVAPTGHDTF